ncbi:MAG: response regulator transcription factor [Lewinellaceae bacterium]|jgi:DNA-binding NarL/FixJ family response regulator|nr:response regulator transcription factor [Lewinellaceae bacterium]
MSKPLHIALADDQELILESLSALFSNTDGAVEVIWCARSGEEALENVRKQKPDVLLLDYTFKGSSLDGGEICRLLTEEFPDLGILMLSVSCEITFIRETLQKGARGYASKEVNKAELLRGIRAVADGEYFLDQSSLGEVIRALLPAKSSGSSLTPREGEVALPYAKGKTIREIASSLFISEDTVESHIKNLRSKTGASSRFEVAEWLKKNGLWEE